MQGTRPIRISRRGVLKLATAGAALSIFAPAGSSAEADAEQVADGVLEFIRRCAREDGGYAPSPDPKYDGNSDTASSDLAAVTYAAVLARTMGWQLPHPEKSVEFIRRHQKEDGRFVNLGGKMKPDDPLAILYNTTQGVVALRALGERPKIDPSPVMARFFRDDGYKKLPWYTTSFFPLFYAALGQSFPAERRDALTAHLVSHQAADGYVQDHVAATFHLAHFFRLIDRAVPRAAEMVARTLHDQKENGGWDIKQPDWDVHACFDALFILRQLGGNAPRVRDAIAGGGGWAMRCRNDDGGFGHFPGRHSDMDAVYFNFGSMIQAGLAPGAKTDLPDGNTLGWGHAMRPSSRR